MPILWGHVMFRIILSLALAAPLSLVALDPASAQDGAKPRRVGVLMGLSLSDPIVRRHWEALVDGLRKRGWEQGRNLVLEGRFSGPDLVRYHELAAELVALKVDVIVAGNSQSIEAARLKTTTIPIVMVSPSDPVGSGFVASLVRPGGNVTGLANRLETVVGKHFELLKAVKPGLERVAIMYSADNAGSVATLRYQLEQMAPRLGLMLLPVPISKPADIEEALAGVSREQTQALHIHPTPVVVAVREKIVTFATEHRLPTVSAMMARDGVLMTYGPNFSEIWRRSAAYVDLILKGANPAELPVEQVDRFELVVNLKIARELGLTIPPSILLRADEVIE